MTRPIGVGIIGCGFVVDFYLRTMRNHPQLETRGVFDIVPERALHCGHHFGVPVYRSLEELLSDSRVDIALNLTNPAAHYAVSRACLEAGKHVYSEKPLATSFVEAASLVELAARKNLAISMAPCTVLGESAQTAWKALRDGRIGRPWLVYAELDDGPTHTMEYRSWRSESGSAWPYEDEFKVGATLEHAGYLLTWLVALLGPARSVTGFSSTIVREKFPDISECGPDFSCGLIEFRSGAVARITCSTLAPVDRSLRIMGDQGTLHVADCWRFNSRVSLLKQGLLRTKRERLPLLPGPMIRETYWKRPVLDLSGGASALISAFREQWTSHRIDFARGLGDMASALLAQREPRLSGAFCLHVNEVMLAIHDPQGMGCPRRLVSDPGAMPPMPWA